MIHPLHKSSIRSRWKLITVEVAQHLPYTIVGTLIAMAAVWWLGTQQRSLDHPEAAFGQYGSLFHMFHPLHICLSAIATTSLFWRHERHVARALVVGALGTIIPCGLSDYVFPYVGGRLLGQSMHLHMCIIEEPQLFFPFLGFGLLGGFWAEKRLTGSHLFSHGAHVFVISAASLLYLMSFGFTGWLIDHRLLFPVFAIIVIAVWVPCCVSDVIVPASTVHLHHHHTV